MSELYVVQIIKDGEIYWQSSPSHLKTAEFILLENKRFIHEKDGDIIQIISHSEPELFDPHKPILPKKFNLARRIAELIS